MNANGIIIGAGIIGSAVAYELSRRGVSNLHVVDIDLEGTFSSTERNAGGVRHLWQHRVNIDLSRVSIDFFSKNQAEVGFRQVGYLWLFERATDAKVIYESARKANLNYELWSSKDVSEKYPFIDNVKDIEAALYGPNNGLINSNALKNFYRAGAKKLGVMFHDAVAVTNVSETASGVHCALYRFKDQSEAFGFLQTPSQFRFNNRTETATGSFAVFCGGPWSQWFYQSLGLKPLTEPIRRQIVTFKADGPSLTPYGMVIDTSRVYFHPEALNVMAGVVLKEEVSGYRFDCDNDFFETRIWPQLFHRSHHFERLRYITGWGGLYSYTADTTGILGRMPGKKLLFEAHSFTGRGVMQSYGAAVALADMVINDTFSTIDARALSSDRFRLGNLLQESLHI